MKKMIRIMCILCLLVLCGCTKDYDRNDIRDYVKDSCGISDFKVSSEPQEMHSDEDEYTDYLWTVTEGNGRVFHVLDNYYWGMEALTNSLACDREYVMLKELFADTSHDMLYLYEEEWEGMLNTQIRGDYSNRRQLHLLADELKELLAQNREGTGVFYDFRCMHPYRSIGDYEIKDADAYGRARQPQDVDISEGDTNYLLLCLDHRYENMNEYTKEETAAALENYPRRLAYLDQESGTYVFYDDLVESRMGYGISFACLYEILKQAGFDPSGSPAHYTVSAPDGTVYEFSYDFIENDAYYYLRNGEKTDTGYYFYNHFQYRKVEEMFGVSVRAAYQLEEQ